MKSTRQIDFFRQRAPVVAEALIGDIFQYEQYQGIITETEAYMGKNDPASHAHRGQTKRNTPMFGSPGISYIYLIYGMHHCFNIVTQNKGEPGAILIRGIYLIHPYKKLLSGPGRLCKALDITLSQNNLPWSSPSRCILKGPSPSIEKSTRIGIKKGQDLLWRFHTDNYVC